MWSCNKPIPNEWYLCRHHHSLWIDTEFQLIDRCKCGRFKEKKYPQCGICYFKQLRPEQSDTWAIGDKNREHWWVYILMLDGNKLDIGHAGNLDKRLAQHKNGKVPRTAGRNPRLYWCYSLPTREAATEFEMRLKKVYLVSPWTVRQMVANTIQ